MKFTPSFFLLAMVANLASVFAQNTCDDCVPAFLSSSIPPAQAFCGNGDPLQQLPNFPDFEPNCDGGINVAVLKYTLGETAECAGSSASGLPMDLGAFQLGNFTATGLTSTSAFYPTGNGMTWTVYPQNLARLQGTIANANNIGAKFDVDFYFVQPTTGSQWIADGESLNTSSAIGDDALDWSIWRIKPQISKLVGREDLDGELIYVEPSVLDISYPFQEGDGGNTVSEARGLGGSFDWVTCVEGTVYGGYGTTALDLNGCNQEEATCASNVDAVGQYFIGNLNHFDQTEAFVDLLDETPPLFQEVPLDYVLNCPVDLNALDGQNSILVSDECSSFELDTTDQILAGSCPNAYTRVRTFTATDGCGLSSEHVQTIEVRDEVGPTLIVPEDATFDCSEEILQQPATAYDECDGPLAVTEIPAIVVPGGCPGEYNIYREFTVQDLCGNGASGQQTIQVRDQMPPEITLPPDVVLPCGDSFVYPEASAVDNCTPADSITWAVFNSLPPTSCPQEYILERTFLATDQCDNSVTATQTVTVTDLDLPYFDFVPEDYSIGCDEEAVFEEAVAKDDCSSFTVEEERDTVFLGCLQNYDLVRTFVVTDACGNVVEAEQIISVRDEVAPTILSEHPSETIECSDIWMPTGLEAEDLCSNVSWAVISDTVGDSSTGSYQIQVTLTASDACGNSSSQELELEVLDTQAPVFVSFPKDMELSCEQPIPFEPAVAEDVCSETTTVHFDTFIPSETEGVYTVERTFVSTDAQGNSVEATQTFSVLDQVAPTFSFVPNDYTSECSDPLILMDPEAFDNCAEVSIVISTQTVQGNAVGNYTVLRTFTATDDAGNSTQAQQTITVQDTTAPEFTSAPADYTTECSDVLFLGDASASDNCGEVTIEVSSETIPGNGESNFTLVRTFTATDEAGNSNEEQQTITVQDTTAPEFTFIPADYTAECSDVLFDDASASDNCGDVAIEVSSETIAGDAAGNYTVVRTFTAMDDSGNSTQAQQTITVEDTTAPGFTSVPADYTVECSDVVLEEAAASDNCGEVTLEVSSIMIPGDAEGNYTLVRTFTATDDAGNSTEATQTIVVEDTTAPELAIPEDYTIECSEGLVLEAPQAEDNCGSTSIATEVQTIAGNAAGNYTVVRTFTATDDAGNSAVATQTITVQDTTAPELIIPADYTSECSDGLVLEAPQADDNCGTATIATEVQTIAGNAAGNFTVVRTFTTTDDAGNSAVAQQTITVQDTTAPELIIPADYTSECSDALIFDDATATDNCGPVNLELTEDTILGDAEGNYTLVRTFTATDDAGNSTEATQTITVVDTTAPEFTSVPSDYTSECSDDLILDDASASDNCGDVAIEVSSITIPGDAAGNYTVVRTFAATDDAGNSTQAQQTITVEDTRAPDLVIPDNYTSECSVDLILDDATVSDNCGEVTMEVSSITIPGDATGNYTVVRTFTATDDAGNSTEATQTIIVEDTTAPIFVFFPSDANVECDLSWPNEMPEVSDNCGTVQVALQTDTLSGVCGGLLILERTFTATDDAGNVEIATQRLTQVDTTAPVIEWEDFVDLACSQNLNNIPLPVVSDACSDDVTLIWNDEEISGGCTLPIAQLLRTYTAFDQCGNVANAEQVIQLTDNEAPVWTSLPEDQTIECTETYDVVLPTFTDNCATPSLVWSSDTLGVYEDGFYEVVFTFIASDDCDNVNVHTQSLTVVDSAAPVWTSFPEDQTINCTDPVDTTFAEAEDGCSQTANVSVDETWAPGICEGSGVWIRTFTAIDASGNEAIRSQSIEVADVTPPSFLMVPMNNLLECDQAMPNTLATATDDCSEVTVTSELDTLAGINDQNFDIVVHFVATDACGNSADTSYMVTFVDSTPPAFTFIPEDLEVECAETFILDEAQAIDNCSEEVAISVDTDTIPGVGQGNYTLVRTFTATDPSSNAFTSESVQTIVVSDSTPPTFTFVPEDITIACDQELPSDLATADDLCGAVTVEVASEINLGSATGNYTVIRTFLATDDAGNTVSESQIVTVQDLTPPIFLLLPTDTTVACTAALPVASVNINDDCGTTEWTHMDSLLEGDCPGNHVWLRTFTAWDDAGNTATHVQTIEVVDSVAPVFTFVPDTATWECNAPAVLDSAVAIDNCSGVTLTAQLDTLEGQEGIGWDLQVTWSAIDGCGNANSVIQVIEVLDGLAPTILSGPADTILSWGAPFLLEEWQSEILAEDGCTSVGNLIYSHEVDTLETTEPCVDIVSITWSVTDLAGNHSEVDQMVQLNDNDAPEVTEWPLDLALTCDEVWVPVLPEALDDNPFTWSEQLDTLAGSCPSDIVIQRTLLATDVCGNATTSWVQSISFVDSVAPVVTSWPQDLLLQDVDLVPDCEQDSVVWTDDCNDVDIFCTTDTLETYCPGSMLLERTYDVMDACGNATAVTQSILVEDVQPPSWLNFPEDVVVGCDSLLEAFPLDALIAMDNASSESELVVTFLDEVENGDNCVWAKTYTYALEDGCGNRIESSYAVTWQDTLAPSLLDPLPSLELFCTSEIPSCEDAMVEAEDLCNDWSWSCDDNFESGDCNGPDCILLRQITLTDACGNARTEEQTMVISEPPTVPELPTGFSPNNDNFNDVYLIRNAGPELGVPPCDWLTNTKLTVYDRWGSVVYESNDVTQPWDGTNLNGVQLPVGTYFVVFDANGTPYRASVDLRR
tara:strand:+ start:19649 stop:27697 length:8049 start_codon:yes stop_codon:yes gene_type:complete